MALLTSPFQNLTSTVPVSVGATATTMTFSTSVLGYPAARITNAGTAAAFIQFINTSNTTTVAITNSQPILASQSVVLATGGLQAMASIAASTFTTTIFVTGGQGGTAA